MVTKTFFLIGFFISLIVLSLVLLRGDKDTWICKDGQWINYRGLKTLAILALWAQQV